MPVLDPAYLADSASLIGYGQYQVAEDTRNLVVATTYSTHQFFSTDHGDHLATGNRFVGPFPLEAGDPLFVIVIMPQFEVS